MLPDWKREHFVTGGGRPYLYYVVFGEIETSQLLPSAYRSLGLWQGIEASEFDTAGTAQLRGTFSCDVIGWNEFCESNRDAADAVGHARNCIVIRGEIEDSPSLNYLRDAVGVITWMLDQGGCAVFDAQIFRWWSPAEWREKIFEPKQPVISNHTVLMSSDESDPGLRWLHTRGMRKFGRPDVSVHNVTAPHYDGAVDLCYRLMNWQALGHVIPQGYQIQMASLPPDGVCTYGGDVDDPDFNNVHIEVVWPGQSPSR